MANDDVPIEQLWRQQLPVKRLSLEEIRTRAKAFDEKVQRWNLVAGLTMALLLVTTAGEVWVDTAVLERAGDLMLFLAVLCVVYWFGRTRADARPATLGQSSCIEHYQRQLVRPRDLSRDGWKFVLPFVPGLGLIIVGRAVEGRPATQVAAMIAVALVALGGVLWAIARSGSRLEREIAALD